MSLISKDSKATLKTLKARNLELKKSIVRIKATRNIDNDSIQSSQIQQQNQLPLEKYPLFKTVKESVTTLTHFGSTSWAALIDTEPVLKAIVTQVHAVLRHEHHEYDIRRRTELKQFSNVKSSQDSDSFVRKGRSLLSQMGLEREDHLEFLKEMLQQVENQLPSGDLLKHFLQMYKDYNSMKALGTFLVDFDSLNDAVSEFIKIDENGKSKLNISLPRDLDKMSHFLLFLSSLSFMIFIRNQSLKEKNTGLNYLIFLEYGDALFNLLHNYLADKGELRLLYTVETFQALFISGTFQKYVPHTKMIDDSDGAKTAIYIRKIVSLGKLLNLNKNVDIYYAHKSEKIRKSLKSLWYSVGAYDCLEALEVGIPPKIKVPFIRYDDFTSQFTEIPIVMNQVLKLYYQIELMNNTTNFINFIEKKIIKPLKDLLRFKFNSLENDINEFLKFDFNNISSTQEFFTRGQSFASRCLIYSTIQTFYHICFKRLKILNADKSPFFERIKLLTWKYTLLIPFIMKELFKGYHRLIRHENNEAFYPVASLLMSVFPYMRLAQRRITIFASARFMECFNFDKVSNTANKFFYQSDNREDEIYEMLKKEGLYQKEYNILNYGDLDIDDDEIKLFEKFKELNDNKYIIVILAKTMQSSIKLLSNEYYNFNFVTYNYIFFFLLKMSNFFLNQAFPASGYNKLYYNDKIKMETPKTTNSSNSTPAEFDFSELFEKAIDTRSQKFDFNNFFKNSYSSTFRDHDINNDVLLDDFFANLNMPLVGDSKLYSS